MVTNVRLLRSGSRNATVSWDPPEQKNGVIRSYRVVYTPLAQRVQPCQELTQLDTTVMVSPAHHSANLTPLRPYTKYRFSVTALTIKYGPERNATFDTDQAVPEGVPTQLQYTRISQDTDALTWAEVPCEQRNGPITSYNVEMDSVDPWDTKLRHKTVNWTSITYRDLLPYTNYEAKVYAENGAGRSPLFASTNFTTPPAPISTAVVNVEVLDTIYFTLAQLNCSLSHTFNGVLAKSWLPDSVLLNISETPEFYLRGLVPGSTYLVCVVAETSAGFGNAICDNFTTKVSASIWSSEQTESSLKIQWDPPVRKNGALTGYKLNSSLSHTFNGIPAKPWLPLSGLLNSLDSREFYLRGLIPGSTYLVCVKAETSAGSGNATCGNFSTKAAVPDAPTRIWSPEQTESSLKILWNPPVRRNGALTGYKLNSSLSHTYNDILKKSRLPKSVLLNVSDSPEFYLRGLVPGSTYLVCVEAKTSAGFGKDICDNFTTKVSAPDAPSTLRSSEQTNSSLKIQWNPPVRKNGALTGYKLNSSLSHTYNGIPEKSRLPKVVLLNVSHSPEFHLQGLVPGSTYLVCVEAKTSAGFGNAICNNLSTKAAAPDAPADISSPEQTESSLKIQWNPPVRKNGVLTGYKLNSSLSHTFNGVLAKSWLPKSHLLNMSDSPEFYLRGLVPGSTYLVCVQAKSSAGFGDGVCGNFTTKISAPDAPANIWSSEQTESSIKVQWDPPVHKNGALTGYKLNSSVSHTFNGIPAKSLLPKSDSLNVSDSPEFYLRGLIPGSAYLVCVKARTSAGFGNAICDNFTTKVSAPDAPANIWLSEKTETSMKIKWDPPVRKNGALTGYKLNFSLSHTYNEILIKEWVRKSVLLNSSDSPEFCLQGLVPGSTYLVCVEAKTSAGFGNAICDNFSTETSAPDAPATLRSSEETEDSLRIQWDPPVRKNGALSGYRLNSSLSHTFNGILAKSRAPKSDFLNSSDSPEYYLQDLDPGSNVLGLCRG
ncbi:hypothetical protein MTO96_008758 [Rhipicephalus appendiculatus]